MPAQTRPSALRCRIHRDLQLYARAQSEDFDPQDRSRIERLVEGRIPTRLARLHAEEGDTTEAQEWTRLRQEKCRSTAPPPTPQNGSDPPPPPPGCTPPAPPPARARRRAKAVRSLRNEVGDILGMARDLASMTGSNAWSSGRAGRQDKAIQVISQSLVESRCALADATQRLEDATTSRSASRSRKIRVFIAATGVAVALVFGGGLGSAAYAAGAVGFGAVAALA